jgi:hypothetical protein
MRYEVWQLSYETGAIKILYLNISQQQHDLLQSSSLLH